MKTIKIYFSFVIILLIVISCKKYIDMKIPDKGRKPVINCLFNADSIFKVQIYQSHFILDNAESQEITNALVTITENETTIDTLNYSSLGYYSNSQLIPTSGKNYKIVATYDGKTASSTSIIPHPITITKIDTSSFNNQQGGYFSFNVQINDPASETNYYLLKIEKEYNDYYNNNLQTIYSNNNEDPSLDAQWQGAYIINDNLFNGKTKVFQLNIDIFNLYNYYNSLNKFYISLYSISKDYYLYAKTSESQINTNNSPFSEPVLVYNNIENGYGIFAGASVFKSLVLVPSRGTGYPMK